MNHTNAFIRALRSKRYSAQDLVMLYHGSGEIAFEIQVSCVLRHAAIQKIAIDVSEDELKLVNHTEVFTAEDREAFAQRLEGITSIVRKYKGDFLREMNLEIARGARRLAYDLEENQYILGGPPPVPGDERSMYFPRGILQEYGTPYARLGTYPTAMKAYELLCQLDDYRAMAEVKKEDVINAACVYASFQQDRAYADCRLEASAN